MAVLEMCFMWELKDIFRSKITPNFFMMVLEARAIPSRVAISLDNVFLSCSKPSTISCVSLVAENEARNISLWEHVVLQV